MNPESIFRVANTAALVMWTVLAIFQRRRWARQTAVVAAVASLATAYVAIIAWRWSGSAGGFSSLADVSLLFGDPWLLLAGWLHYLAFDLLVGRSEAEDAAARGISPWFVVPCLALTFMFGPAGWLSYQGVRRFASWHSPERSRTGV